MVQQYMQSMSANQRLVERAIFERMQQYEAERHRHMGIISELQNRMSAYEANRISSHDSGHVVESSREAHPALGKEDAVKPHVITSGVGQSQEDMVKSRTVAHAAGRPQEARTPRAEDTSESAAGAPAWTPGDERRLGIGFLNAGTTASGVACYTFAGSTTVEMDLNSDNCRDTNKVCSGCFLATPDANDKVLEVIKCSTAKYKVGGPMSAATSTPDLVEITIINADTDNTVTIKGCDDATCSSPDSTFTLSASSVVVGYCYQGGGNAIYFNPLGEGSTPIFSTVTVGTGGLIISSQKVVGARLTAVPDATGTGDVVARVNDVIARLVSHGLIEADTR